MSTASPPRNFTLDLAERVRGLHGPPAYAVRLREIEDLEERIVRRLRTPQRSKRAADAANQRDLARLTVLVNRHNLYYPIEANLPMQPGTGILIERGEPWRPRPAPSLDALRARAREEAATPGAPG